MMPVNVVPDSARSLSRRLLLIVVAGVLALVMAGTTPSAAQRVSNGEPRSDTVGVPDVPVADDHIRDPAGLLSEAEEASLESDASRLARFGLPSLVMIRSNDMSATRARQLADELRRQWYVESAPGANDGLVLLIVADPAHASPPYSVMSWGANALPHFGIDATTALNIKHNWIDANLTEEHAYQAITFGLRRLIYFSIYDPAPQPPLTTAQTTVQSLVSWIAPVIVLAALIGLVTGWNPASGLPVHADTVAAAALALVFAAAAVWSQSGIGVACALVLVALTAVAWVRHDPRPLSGNHPRSPAKGVAP